jgi:hypothetical protein
MFGSALIPARFLRVAEVTGKPPDVLVAVGVLVGAMAVLLGVGVAVAGTGVFVAGGIVPVGVAVGGTGVLVAGIGVAVGPDPPAVTVTVSNWTGLLAATPMAPERNVPSIAVNFWIPSTDAVRLLLLTSTRMVCHVDAVTVRGVDTNMEATPFTTFTMERVVPPEYSKK